MRVLVTGAAGFLGRQVVAALCRRGHLVRAIRSPQSQPIVPQSAWQSVEDIVADLLVSPDLAQACEGVEAVVHLAGRMRGDSDSIVKSAVEGTRRLLAAMEKTGVRRLVLASSLSVYDWDSNQERLDEDSPLEPRPEARDAYTEAKVHQEQIARDGCTRANIGLIVLRPGVIWGEGREYPPTIGQRIGPLHLLFGAGRQLPVVHVENCADAFAAVLEGPMDLEGTFNLVDHAEVTVWRFVRDHLRRSGCFGLPIPVAYGLGLASVRLLRRLTPGFLVRLLPSFVDPARFVARYRPVRIDSTRLYRAIGWRPPLSYERCLERTYDGRVD